MSAIRWLRRRVVTVSQFGETTSAGDSREPMLSVRDLHVSYGPVTALRGVSFDIASGQCVALIGPNGAGKSSLLTAIAGAVRARRGEIWFFGRALTTLSIEDILRSGVALVPEGRDVFATMTVEENLHLGATIRRDDKAVRADIGDLYQLFPRLQERRCQPAGYLSGGEQQQLAIARALMCRPRLLMLDEPSLGLAPAITKQVFNILRRLRERGTTILLVEQNAGRALEIADRAHIIRDGTIRLSGTPAELVGAPAFDAAYFGVTAV